jgi:SAM-dependent methyltransferase
MSSVCPYCNHQSVLILESNDINRTKAPGPFKYFRCSVCHLIFLDPIPTDISAYYDSAYYHIPFTIEQFALSANQHQHRIKLVQQYVAAGCLLEIGSSYGEFAYLAHQAGFDTQVIEMDAESCQFIEQKLGIKATNSDDPLEALNDVGMFDVIALWHVVEHVPHIWDVLSRSAMHLSPNGILLIATPNPDALQFKLFRRWWAHLDAPRHLYLLPVSLLSNHLRAHGLEVVAINFVDQENAMHEDFGWKKSIMNIMGVSINASSVAAINSNATEPEPKRSVSFRLARWLLQWVSKILMFLSQRIISRRKQSSTYTIILQKKTATQA